MLKKTQGQSVIHANHQKQDIAHSIKANPPELMRMYLFHSTFIPWEQSKDLFFPLANDTVQAIQ